MVKEVEIRIQRLENARNIPLPEAQTRLSAGVDLCAAVKSPVVLQPTNREIIPTGISIALPEGFEAQIRPRSGLAIKNGITVLNSPGTIDADYRGEIGVILINLSDTQFVVEYGMRIAQMIVGPAVGIKWNEVNLLPQSERGIGGFGSTGIKGRGDG